MHNTMVPEQVKTQKIQDGVQVSRLEDKDVIFSIGSALEDFIFMLYLYLLGTLPETFGNTTLPFIPTFAVIESEILYDSPRFFDALIMKLAIGSVVNFMLKREGDMIIKFLNLEPKIDAMMRDVLE
ncbi:hypothetical protein Tco_1386360 [Tanacetum coccineum]